MSVVIWSKTTCPYCDRAKELCNDLGVSYEERIIGEGWTKADLLKVVPEAKTVPQIFIGDTHIGGFNELQVYADNQ